MFSTTLIRIVAGLLFVIAIFLPFSTIFKKAGFSPWLALLMYIPLVNIIVLYVVAYSNWKVVPAAQPLPPPYPPRA